VPTDLRMTADSYHRPTTHALALTPSSVVLDCCPVSHRTCSASIAAQHRPWLDLFTPAGLPNVSRTSTISAEDVRRQRRKISAVGRALHNIHSAFASQD
jgi:hypothetical protein